MGSKNFQENKFVKSVLMNWDTLSIIPAGILIFLSFPSDIKEKF